jgi:hypothetical protein
MGRIAFGTAALMALLVVTGAPQQALAAVGVCKALHAGDRVEDKSEISAKRRALESWLAGAEQHGVEYTRWGIAWNRRLECTHEKGVFSCQAAGHPCTYQQVPPENFVRFKRGT